MMIAHPNAVFPLNIEPGTRYFIDVFDVFDVLDVRDVSDVFEVIEIGPWNF